MDDISILLVRSDNQWQIAENDMCHRLDACFRPVCMQSLV